ncbi:RidA family protein [Sinorhizobium americanum]|jgi:enamine deaminase RidA (YjgF/YER057c/UK114 family)|uniref:Enamine deaminase RidA (YjgF/YER057c/UK114 family) n=1 Tax=Sinorhizobium americanum TaxID=194963 RepID=A0A4R2B7U8_9HYPH|nr:RidA family protein [Sinorhizobium americanum]TCN22788.1 enamine deaminase RidA (YjgF/YER057c/UK114 family) [Sinorhizobium americanum]
MTKTVRDRLHELGIKLPAVGSPTASYVPIKRHGSTILVSGQIPKLDGSIQFVGKVGDTISAEEANQAARLCALNVVAQLDAALDGDLDLIAGCLRLRGFVNAVPDFGGHAAVINGASDLLVEIFGDEGGHTRTAIGVGSLPHGVAVEVDADFEIRA